MLGCHPFTVSSGRKRATGEAMPASARGEGRRSDAGELRRIRVVTKIDPSRVRREIAAEHLRTLMEEAPSQYKSVTPVVETVADAGIASPVARLRPLLTVKG
jgi:tRNA-splicing ligase RtcB